MKSKPLDSTDVVPGPFLDTSVHPKLLLLECPSWLFKLQHFLQAPVHRTLSERASHGPWQSFRFPLSSRRPCTWLYYGLLENYRYYLFMSPFHSPYLELPKVQDLGLRGKSVISQTLSRSALGHSRLGFCLISLAGCPHFKTF